MQHKVITMIGSMKFYDIMLSEEIRLTRLGYIVLHPVLCTDSGNIDELKDVLDSHIRACIDMADIIYVINKDGYIGESTSSELNYVHQCNKQIIVQYNDTLNMLTDFTDPFILKSNTIPFIAGPSGKLRPISVALIGSYRFRDTFIYVNRLLTIFGCNVIMPATWNFSQEYMEKLSDDVHHSIDNIQLFNMRSADQIIVCDSDIPLMSVSTADDGYVGADTGNEIERLNNACNISGESVAPIHYTSKGGLYLFILANRDGK